MYRVYESKYRQMILSDIIQLMLNDSDVVEKVNMIHGNIKNGDDFRDKLIAEFPDLDAEIIPDFSLTDALTFQEAAEIWGLSDGSVLRTAQRRGRFLEGEVRQSGSTWLVTRVAMERLYGEQKNLKESKE